MSVWISLHVIEQYSEAHRMHLYLDSNPQTEHNRTLDILSSSLGKAARLK